MPVETPSFVGVVVVSHSRPLAEELIKFASLMKASPFKVVNAAGLGPMIDEYGTNVELVVESLRLVDQGEGVLVLADIGSGVMSAQAAIGLYGPAAVFADCPLLEGLVAVFASNVEGTSLEQLRAIAEETRGLSKSL